MKETCLPIEYKSWDEIDILFISLYDCTFLEDFGIFKKGDFHKFLDINYDSGYIEAADENGKIIFQKFSISPVISDE